MTLQSSSIRMRLGQESTLHIVLQCKKRAVCPDGDYQVEPPRQMFFGHNLFIFAVT